MYDSVCVLGPTACGKTALAVRLAYELGGAVLSADCRQVYRGLDLGSGKDLGEYEWEEGGRRVCVDAYLIDIVSLDEEYNLFSFQRDFLRVFADLRSQGRIPVIAGGTGLYLDAVIRGYDMHEITPDEALRAELAGLSLEELQARYLRLNPHPHNTTDLLERPRLVRAIEIALHSRGKALHRGLSESKAVRPLILGTSFPRDELRRRIRIRLSERLKAGMIDEVRALHAQGVSWERLERLGLEYKILSVYLRGGYESEAHMEDELAKEIGRFAKRQETWFRRMERSGVEIHWLDPGSLEERIAQARSLLKAACFE